MCRNGHRPDPVGFPVPVSHITAPAPTPPTNCAPPPSPTAAAPNPATSKPQAAPAPEQHINELRADRETAEPQSNRPRSANCWRCASGNDARRLRILLRQTPRRTSVPSSSRSLRARGTVTYPVRALYCTRAATPRSNTPEPPLSGLAGASRAGGGQGRDAELLQRELYKLFLAVDHGPFDVGAADWPYRSRTRLVLRQCCRPRSKAPQPPRGPLPGVSGSRARSVMPSCSRRLRWPSVSPAHTLGWRCRRSHRPTSCPPTVTPGKSSVPSSFVAQQLPHGRVAALPAGGPGRVPVRVDRLECGRPLRVPVQRTGPSKMRQPHPQRPVQHGGRARSTVPSSACTDPPAHLAGTARPLCSSCALTVYETGKWGTS